MVQHTGPQTRQQPRAPRFEIPMLLRYRTAGEDAWHQGRVRNVSRTGVLFTAENLVPDQSTLEITLQLPIEMPGAKAGQVSCLGKVVRTILPAATDDSPAMAAVIESYEFSRAGCV